MVDGPDSGPVEVLQQPDPGQVERVLRRDDAEEVGEGFLREHRMGVRVRQLWKQDKEDNRTRDHVRSG